MERDIMRASTTTRLVFPAALAGLLLAAGAAAAQGGPQRDEWQRVPDVIEALGAAPGAHVADIGAGAGYFTHHLRQAVGVEGRVYAVDISRSAVARLRAELDRLGARNVDVILGEPDDPRLPYGSLDGTLIVNAYHEMTEHRAMLAQIRAALRPGGRLVILDNPARDPESSRETQTGRHELRIDLAARELVEAGFEVVAQDPFFIGDSGSTSGPRMWMVASVRPLLDPPAQRLPGAPEGDAGLFACPFRGPPDALAQRPSPPDSAETRIGDARLKVCYSRPATRGRAIMGELVPFRTPWRAGANEATVLRFDGPVRVGDVSLDPGWYSLYVVPEPEAWTIVINRLADRAGVPIDEWVRSNDIGRVTVAVEDPGRPVEDLTIRFESEGPGAAGLVIEWERSRVRVPVRVVPGPDAGRVGIRLLDAGAPPSYRSRRDRGVLLSWCLSEGFSSKRPVGGRA
jgi:predicted methyltransferase